jgi:outer membrane receptor for ferrienterochelin and colicins
MTRLIPVLLACIFLSPLYAAANVLDTLQVHNIDDVTVTATRTPLPLKNTPVITRVITASQIERDGSATIENLLEKELAGVEFHQAGYGTTMSFQGLDARYVLILIDGERIAGDTYGNIDYSRIPLFDIERIEIVRGASSVLYGSSAMGAVVNIITKMPKKKFEVAAAVRYGTPFQKNTTEELGPGATDVDVDNYRKHIDLPNTKGDLSVGFNLGKLRSRSTVSVRTTDAYKLIGTQSEKRFYKTMNVMRIKQLMPPPPVFEVDRVVHDTTIMVSPDSRGLGVSGWRDWYVGQKLDYKLSDKFRFEVSGTYTNKKRYDFNTSLMDENPMSAMFGTSPFWNYEIYEGYDVRAMMEHSPNENNKIYLTFLREESFRYAYASGIKNDDNTLTAGRYITPKQRHTYNIPRLLWTLRIGDAHRLTTGLEMVNEQLRFDLTESGYGTSKSLNTGAIYVQDEMWSGRKLSFVAGVRADWSDRVGFRVTPKLSAKYNFGDFSLRANYSNGYRMPTLKEMYMEFEIPISSAPTITGNPNLKTETNNYFSLSLDYHNRWLNVSGTFSKSYFRNKIDARWATDADGASMLLYDNVGKSEYGSFELISRIRVTKGLFVNANYNYTYQSSNASESSTQYIFPSPHTATVNINYSFALEPLHIGVTAGMRYVGPKDYEDLMDYVYLPSLIDLSEFKYFTGNYSSHHKGYALCNVAVTIDYPRWFSFTFGVDNVFNYRSKVVNFNSAITPGVNCYARLMFKL